MAILDLRLPQLDPALIGVWKAVGACQLIDIRFDGRVYMADDASALSFEKGGTVMIWDKRRFVRREGSGNTPLGTWYAKDLEETWAFDSDGQMSSTTAFEVTFGLWARSDGGRSMQCKHLLARLTTTQGRLCYQYVDGGEAEYAYRIDGTQWHLSDPETGTPMWGYEAVSAQYDRPTAITSAGFQQRP